MSTRELTVVLLRLMAVWLGCSAVIQLASGAYVWLDAALAPYPATVPVTVGDLVRFGVGQAILAAIQATVAILLLLFAPRLAERICANFPSGDQDAVKPAVGAGDLYHIGCFLMGIFALIRGIRPAVTALAAMAAQGPRLQWTSSQTAGLLEAVLLIGLGLILTFGARGFAAFVTNLGHDPDAVPGQQFGLRLLLVVIVGFALLLMILRSLAG